MKNKQTLLPVLGICACALAVYINTFNAPFVFDDLPGIKNNYLIFGFSHAGQLWKFWPSRFVTFLSFAANWTAHGFSVSGYHALNLAIHIANAILLRTLVLLIFQSPRIKTDGFSKHANSTAFFTALIFAVHPIQTQAVTYIWQRATILASCFCFSALVLYIKARLSSRAKQRVLFSYVGAGLCALVAMFTKEISVSLPFLVLACEGLFFGMSGRRFRILIPVLFAFSLIIPVTFAITRNMNFSELAGVATSQNPNAVYISRGAYFLTQSHALLTYLRLLLLPAGQNIDYDYPVSKGITDPWTLAGFIIFAVLVMLAILLHRRDRILSFSILIFLITLIPQSSIIPKPDLFVEHRLYLPCSGFALFVSRALAEYGRRKSRIAIPLLAGISLLWGSCAIVRNHLWTDPVMLWSDAITKSPGKARPYLNRGLAYAERGLLVQAISDYTTAISLDRSNVEAYNNRGSAYGMNGNLNKSIDDFKKAISINPGYAPAYNNYGVTLSALKKYDMAIANFSHAIQLSPHYADAFKNRGIALLVLKKPVEAANDFSTAFKINPRDTDALRLRAIAFALAGNTDMAERDMKMMERAGRKPDPELINLINGLRR